VAGTLTLMPSTRYISMEDIEVLSVVTAEFIDAFHHGKEEKIHTFQQLRVRIHGYSEDIRKLLIEH
jgi:hemerythrin-like domain-containing protein